MNDLMSFLTFQLQALTRYFRLARGEGAKSGCSMEIWRDMERLRKIRKERILEKKDDLKKKGESWDRKEFKTGSSASNSKIEWLILQAFT